MTYKTLSKQVHFRQQQGSSSVRLTQRGYGGKGMFGIPLRILPTLKEQFEIISARINELPRLMDAAKGKEEHARLQRELRAKISTAGDMRKVLYEGSRLAMERIFIKVARARLPEELFFDILREAETYWRGQGIDKFVPEPNKTQKRRAYRKLTYRNFKAGQS